MRKWILGLTMVTLVAVFAGQALAEDAAVSASADTQVTTPSAQASEQGKAHAHHGKKKGHRRHPRHNAEEKKA